MAIVYGIRNNDGAPIYFASREERDAAWAELILQDAHSAIDKENAERAALAAELAERAEMLGLEP